MKFEDKMPGELPDGSYRDSDHPDSFEEMAIWGRFLDFAQADNRRIAETLEVNNITEDWQAEAWELELGIAPAEGASLSERAAAIIARLTFMSTGKKADIENAAKGVLGYKPEILTSPPAFWLRFKGGFTSTSGHYLVDDSHKFAIWIVLQSAITGKPYNVTPCIEAVRRVLGADCRNIGFWFDDNGVFDYLNFPPWPDGGDANITT